MANPNFERFFERLYTTTTELLTQQVDLFNAASGGAIVLRSQPIVSDYSQASFFGKVNGLVLSRNAYGNAVLPEVELTHLSDIMVKIGRTTPVMKMNANDMAWIGQNTELAAATYALQLAPDMLADMLNTGIGACASAIKTASTAPAPLVLDKTGILNNQALTNVDLVDASAFFGDQAARLQTWIMHSQVLHKLYSANIVNFNQLFTYGTVRIVADIFGRNFVMTDSPNLIVTAAPNTYRTLGLAGEAIVCAQNNDYTDAVVQTLGTENIKRSMQAEWSFNLGLKGYKWDIANGGASPSASALVLGTNWDKVATNNKDTAGVMIETKLLNSPT